MSVTAYRELFDEDLERWIAQVQGVAAMLEVVRKYPDAREFAFRHWRHDQLFTCARCAKDFVGVKDDGVAEDDEILCEECRNR